MAILMGSYGHYRAYRVKGLIVNHRSPLSPSSAEFPDVPERILPADGRATVGGIFNRIMKESGKTQNFAVYLVSVVSHARLWLPAILGWCWCVWPGVAWCQA